MRKPIKKFNKEARKSGKIQAETGEESIFNREPREPREKLKPAKALDFQLLMPDFRGVLIVLIEKRLTHLNDG